MELRTLRIHVVLVHLDGRTGVTRVGGLPLLPSNPKPQASPCQHLISHEEEALLEGKANHSLDALAGLHLPWGAGDPACPGSDSGSELCGARARGVGGGWEGLTGGG